MLTQQEIVEAVAKQLQKKDLSRQAVSVLQKATDNVLKRIKQNVDAQIKEDSSPIVEKFVEEAGKNMLALTQTWSDGVRNDLVVFPEGTRYIWRDGQMTTIIIEQNPQVRHVNVYGKMYLLSMPYVQFIMNFNSHKFIGSLVATCTKKPITELDQAANYLPLGNIDVNHCVCMGGYRFPQEGNMTDVVNAIIGQFWQSEFTFDNGGFLTAWLTSNNLSVPKDREDVQQGFVEWAKKTQDNSLYATERTTVYRNGKTFRSFLAKDSSTKNGSASIVNNLKNEILTAIASIGGDIQGLLTNLDLKTENREKAHVETLQGILKEIMVQAYAELWEYLQKQLQAEKAKLQLEMQAKATELKKEFLQFMDKK